MQRWLALLLILIAGGCTSSSQRVTVVWVSLDGFRGDYLERYKPPTLSRLAAEGAYTSQLKPIFPSLTFPNHISQVTGTTTDRHGIPGNNFYDSTINDSFSFPETADTLRAEPIWVTAKRQGVRVASLNWPMSNRQTGPWKSDYFFERFDRQETDRQRLEKVVQIIKEDQARPPLRLVLSYTSSIDSVGHRYGPDSPQIAQAIQETDQLIDSFAKSVIEWFEASHEKDDELILLFTSDHGMQTIHTLVNMELIIGSELAKDIKIVNGGPVSMIHLNGLPLEQREARAAQIVAKLRERSFISAWKTSDMPATLHFADAARVGSVVALLPPGYSFTTTRLAATQPATPDQVATHGYDPATSPNMLAGAIVWRYRHRIGGVDLGPIDNTQWHATVARWLGIEPAAGADRRAIRLP